MAGYATSLYRQTMVEKILIGSGNTANVSKHLKKGY